MWKIFFYIFLYIRNISIIIHSFIHFINISLVPTICQPILIHSYNLVIYLGITLSPSHKDVLIIVKDNHKNTKSTLFFSVMEVLLWASKKRKKSFFKEQFWSLCISLNAKDLHSLMAFLPSCLETEK